jgi:hypothetical protein
MAAEFASVMAGAASAHQAASATREDTSQQRAGRTRRTRADPQRAQQRATAAAADAPAALQTLSRLQQLANASPQVAQLRRLQAMADCRNATVAQFVGGPEEEELVQGKFATAELPAQLQQAPRANNTGLPDQLKSGIESLSGLSMDHVRVHYNSSQPAQLNALAYAQGSDIHLAPGQERHLPHEAWHLVQQAQGRVRPTLQMQEGVPVNDDVGLEREADVMGAKALSGAPDRRPLAPAERLAQPGASQRRRSGVDLVQLVTVSVDNYRPLMAANEGNFALGEATKTQANKIGQDWIGKPVKSQINVSGDEFRQYRKPKFKPKLNKLQANVESRNSTTGSWTKNGHIDIVEPATKKE